MHEISLANRIMDELAKKEFSKAEIDVGIISIHDTPHSKNALKKMLSGFFPEKKIKLNFLYPQLACECGNIQAINEKMECEKCGTKMRLETNEGFRIKKLEI